MGKDCVIKHSLNPTYLYLCRHGQSQYNACGRLQGQLESPLTSLGKQQARDLALRAKAWNIKHIISSPLGRAQQTADICAQALKLSMAVCSGFEERHYGHWQGSYIEQLADFVVFKQQCYLKKDWLPCEGAESTENVRGRMLKQLSLLNQNHTGNILVISHGDAIDCLLSKWTTPKNISNSQHLRLVKNTNSFVWDEQCTAF
tara:strand:- start:356 stop:961 length:606 start_codon:yes stop_codon:yes gene_type:complete